MKRLHSASRGRRAAWRVRSALTGARPGVGFHSPGVFGTLAAAGAGARLLELDANACVTRWDRIEPGLRAGITAGLDDRDDALRLGAFHGARSGPCWPRRGWGRLARTSDVASRRCSVPNTSTCRRCRPRHAGRPGAGLQARTPCNIYLNLVVRAARRRAPDVDRIELMLPWVPHSTAPADRPAPGSHSAQAAAAIAGAAT